MSSSDGGMRLETSSSSEDDGPARDIEHESDGDAEGRPSKALRSFAECMKETAAQLTGCAHGILLCVSRRSGRVLIALETSVPPSSSASTASSDGVFLGHAREHFPGLELWAYAEDHDSRSVRAWWESLVAASNARSPKLVAPELHVARRHRAGHTVPMRLFPLCAQPALAGAVFLFEAPVVVQPLLRPPRTSAADEGEKVLGYMHRLNDVLNLGVWEYDFASGGIWWSPKLYHMFRRSPDLGPMQQAEFGAAVHPEDALRWAQVNEETLSSGGCMIQATRLRRMDGTFWNAMAHSYVEREPDGTPARMWGIFFDDTARAEREAAVQRMREKTLVAERVAAEQQLFISYVFHEVRNPLNVVSLGLASIADLVPLPPGGELDVITGSMTQNIQDATDMLNNMIDLTRLEDGIFSVQLETVDVAEALRRTARAHEAVALRKKLRLRLRLPEGEQQRAALTVRADKYRLAQLFNNLAGNALKFTPEAGTLELSVALLSEAQLMQQRAHAVWFGGPRPGKRPLDKSSMGDAPAGVGAPEAMELISATSAAIRAKLHASKSASAAAAASSSSSDAVAPPEPAQPSYVVVCIKDSGCGIAPEDVASLFKPFKQVSALEKQNGKGAGLGLAISRRIVELHHGWVVVDSTVGAGSEFCVVLPHYASAPGSARSPALQRHESSGGDSADASASDEANSGQPAKKMRKRAPGLWRRAAAAEGSCSSGDAQQQQQQGSALGEVDVLLVEDDPIVTRMLSQRLHKSGARSVREFPNGQAFLDCVAEGGTHERSVVLLDDVMPVLSGTETLRQLQRAPFSEQFRGRVIVCSGNASMADMRRFLESGAHGFLAKPITMPKLLAAIDELFE